MEERKCVGWQEQETSRLFSAVQEAQGSGAPLRQVFEDLSVDLGRKPNSIRNYYYACLRNQEQNTPRVQAFIPFTEAETHDLLRQVLTGCGQGMSVRACVMRMQTAITAECCAIRISTARFEASSGDDCAGAAGAAGRGCCCARAGEESA